VQSVFHCTTRLTFGALRIMSADAILRDVEKCRIHPARPQNLKWPTEGRRVVYREEIEEWLAVTLAMIAGFLDAYGMITYRIYLSFMSGNTTQAGYEIGQGKFGPALYSVLLAIVFFVGGSFAGTLLARSSVQRIRRLVFAAIAASLALIIGFAQFGFSSNWVSIAVISSAMGAMNTALSRIGDKSVSLTFVTGTLSRIGFQLALAVRRAPVEDSQGAWDTHARRALQLAAIWAGFLSGALLSGTATPRFGVWALSFPVLALSVLVGFDGSSSEPAQRGEEFKEIREGQ
jgi:uncharacterized membrane protein YoaK (UPF0700 family)